MKLPSLRLAATLVLVLVETAGCGDSGGQTSLSPCVDVARHIPHSVVTVQNINAYSTSQPAGEFSDSGEHHVVDIQCPVAFGHLSDGSGGTVGVALTRVTAPSPNGTSPARFLGTVIMGRMRNNVCLSARIDTRGQPPVAAGCYDTTKPLAAQAVVHGNMAIVVWVSGERPTAQDAARRRQLLESAARTVVDTAARLS